MKYWHFYAFIPILYYCVYLLHCKLTFRIEMCSHAFDTAFTHCVIESNASMC